MWNEVVMAVLKACLCLRETTKFYHIYPNAKTTVIEDDLQIKHICQGNMYLSKSKMTPQKYNTCQKKIFYY
jgi:hypothetical protein